MIITDTRRDQETETRPERPSALSVQRDSIPESLRERENWCGWFFEFRNKAWTKRPCDSHGTPIKSTDPRNGESFDSVYALYQAGGADGVGLILKGDGLVATDLDGCTPETAAPLLLDTYTETSPGGNGLRQIGLGTKPTDRCKENTPAPAVKAIEIYERERYVTITGHRLEDYPADVRPVQNALEALCKRLWPTEKNPVSSGDLEPDYSEPTAQDEERLEHARHARNGFKFMATYDDGDTSLHDGDASGADQGLANNLAFWLDKDPQAMDRCFRASALYRPKWDERRGALTYGQRTIQRAIADTTDTFGDAFADTPETSGELRAVDLAAVWDQEPEPPRSVLATYNPEGVVTLASGHGEAGKTTLFLAMAAHVAAGKPFAGLPVERERVVFFSFEDGERIIHLRLRRICRAYDLPYKAVLEYLTVVDGSDVDACLMIEDQKGRMKRTPMFDKLEQCAAGHRLIVIDNASDVYGGNENVRVQVRAFMRALTELAKKLSAAVVLLAHVDKATAKTGNGGGNSYSGSTAWHNSARSRVFLENDEGFLTLTHEKSNLLPKTRDLRLSINDQGVPVPLCDFDNRADDFDDLLPVFAAAVKAGQTVYNNLTPGSYSAMNVLSNFDELPRRYTGKHGRKLCAKAITSLLSAGKLKTETYQKSNRTTGERIVPALVVVHEGDWNDD